MKLPLLLVPLLALAGVLGVSSHAVAQTGETRTINVGGGGSGIAANNFFPNEITIAKGDTIHFTNPYEEPHTTTFVPQGMAVPPLIIAPPNFNPLALNATGTAGAVTDFEPHAYYNSGFMFKGAAVDV